MGLGALLASHGLPYVASVLAYTAGDGLAVRLPNRDIFGTRDRPSVALTFDDGPDPLGTAAVLAVLKDHDVRATFFVVGERVEKYPQTVRAIVDDGHEVGVHGHRHRSALGLTPRAMSDELTRCVEAIVGCGAPYPLWFRPPYGSLSTASLLSARRLGLKPILWSAWGRDWTREATSESILARVARGRTLGGTVLLHDSPSRSSVGNWQATVKALPSLITQLRDERLEFATVSEHLATNDSGRAST